MHVILKLNSEWKRVKTYCCTATRKVEEGIWTVSLGHLIQHWQHFDGMLWLHRWQRIKQSNNKMVKTFSMTIWTAVNMLSPHSFFLQLVNYNTSPKQISAMALWGKLKWQCQTNTHFCPTRYIWSLASLTQRPPSPRSMLNSSFSSFTVML